MPLLEARGMVRTYGQVVALDGADFDVEAGEVTALIGDNYLALTQARDRIDLTPAGTPMVFSTDGGEQRALADYLARLGSFTEQDAGSEFDLRIQNLGRRTDAVLAPYLRRIDPVAGGTAIDFRSLPGRRYSLQSSESIDGSWETLTPQTTGDGTLRRLLDSRPGSSAQRYYRVGVLP